MTYQAQIAAALERASDERREAASNTPDDGTYTDALLAGAALQLLSLAEQFKAGDYDELLMRGYAALIENPETASDMSNAMAAVIAKVGIEPGYVHPDDVLDEALNEARRS